MIYHVLLVYRRLTAMTCCYKGKADRSMNYKLQLLRDLIYNLVSIYFYDSLELLDDCPLTSLPLWFIEKWWSEQLFLDWVGIRSMGLLILVFLPWTLQKVSWHRCAYLAISCNLCAVFDFVVWCTTVLWFLDKHYMSDLISFFLVQGTFLPSPYTIFNYGPWC